jgi:hypothetical protein
MSLGKWVEYGWLGGNQPILVSSKAFATALRFYTPIRVTSSLRGPLRRVLSWPRGMAVDHGSPWQRHALQVHEAVG